MEAQKASEGHWLTTMMERTGPGEAAFTTTTWVETNRWIDPYTLVIEERETFESEPRTVMTETITPSGLDLMVEDAEGRIAFPVPLVTTCRYDPKTDRYHVDMAFERVIGGETFDTVNQIEIDDDHYVIIRLGRPKGSKAPRRLISAQSGRRPEMSPH